MVIHDTAPATFQKNSLNALLLAYCNLINVKYNIYDAKNHINWEWEEGIPYSEYSKFVFLAKGLGSHNMCLRTVLHISLIKTPTKKVIVCKSRRNSINVTKPDRITKGVKLNIANNFPNRSPLGYSTNVRDNGTQSMELSYPVVFSPIESILKMSSNCCEAYSTLCSQSMVS